MKCVSPHYIMHINNIEVHFYKRTRELRVVLLLMLRVYLQNQIQVMVRPRWHEGGDPLKSLQTEIEGDPC